MGSFCRRHPGGDKMQSQSWVVFLVPLCLSSPIGELSSLLSLSPRPNPALPPALLASTDLLGPSLLGGIGGRKLSMMAFLRSSPRFSVLVRALELTELSPSLEAGGGGPFTLFAPTNFAFDLVGRDAMLGDVPGLRKALLRHIVREKLPSLSFPAGVSQVDTASREKATIAVLLGRVAIYTSAGAAEVLDTDIYTSNGIIHVVDHVV